MSNLTRWDPFSEMLSLHDAMSQILQDSFVAPSRATSGLSMPINLSESDGEYCVEASLPGVRPEDVEITLQQRTLMINAEARQEQRRGGENEHFHMLERRYGQISRAITLPQDVDADQIKATMDGGILRLEIPKSTQTRARKISVNTSSDSQRQMTTRGAGGQGGSSQDDTRERQLDEAAMDRTAQAGVGGAFDAAPDATQEREEMRKDAERAFGGQKGGGGQSQSS